MFNFLKKDKEKKKESKPYNPDPRYTGEVCALCGQPDTEKKWMGQHWHKKCLRKAKKQAKGMM